MQLTIDTQYPVWRSAKVKSSQQLTLESKQIEREDFTGVSGELSLYLDEMGPLPKVKLVKVEDKYFIGSDDAFYAMRAWHTVSKSESVSADILILDYDEAGIEESIKAAYGSAAVVSVQQPIKESIDRVGARKAMLRKMDEIRLMSQSSDVGLIIKSYLKGYNEGGVSVPLLYGHSGIAKSALVAEAVDQLDAEKPNSWGYRLVVIKAGFMDNADLLGYATQEDVTLPDAQGEMRTVKGYLDAPMQEFMTCTDGFLRNVRDVLSGVSAADLAAFSSDDKKFYEKMKFYAKTPVLFLDEINRTKPEVLNQMMVIMNQKRFNTYKLKEAPIICAANWNVEMPPEIAKEIYVVETIADPAKIDRFQPLLVSHNDFSVVNSGRNYLEKKFKKMGDTEDEKLWNKFVSSLLQKALDAGLLHNPTKLDPKAQIVKYPTFRGWEQFLTILEGSWKNGTISMDRNIPDAIFGDKPGDSIMALIDVMTDVVVKMMPKRHPMDSLIDEGIKSQVPVLITGRFGIAKTSRIVQAAERAGIPSDLIMEFDLSSIDRATVRGYPFPTDLTHSIADDSVVAENSTLAKKLLAKIATDPSTPRRTTRYNPNVQLLEAVSKARLTGKTLIIFLDELNRCNPIVQSAVFDAISEKTLFGVSLKGIKYVVLSAANVSTTDVAYDSSELDAATYGRFMTYYKESFDMEDLKSFAAWADTKFSGVLVRAIQSLVKDKKKAEELLDVMNKKYDGFNISMRLSSFRSFTNVNDFLREYQGYLLTYPFARDLASPDDAVKYFTSNFWLGRIDDQNVEVLDNELFPGSPYKMCRGVSEFVQFASENLGVLNKQVFTEVCFDVDRRMAGVVDLKVSSVVDTKDPIWNVLVNQIIDTHFTEYINKVEAIRMTPEAVVKKVGNVVQVSESVPGFAKTLAAEIADSDFSEEELELLIKELESYVDYAGMDVTVVSAEIQAILSTTIKGHPINAVYCKIRAVVKLITIKNVLDLVNILPSASQLVPYTNKHRVGSMFLSFCGMDSLIIEFVKDSIAVIEVVELAPTFEFEAFNRIMIEQSMTDVAEFKSTVDGSGLKIQMSGKYDRKLYMDEAYTMALLMNTAASVDELKDFQGLQKADDSTAVTTMLYAMKKSMYNDKSMAFLKALTYPIDKILCTRFINFFRSVFS